ncbi:MAG: zinc-ribbon domain-containing protein [Christensenellales bacterium]|jgi:predicted nucleic acid-binding Zn ribbon protein
MKQCKQCGAANSDDALFCSQCGARVEHEYSVPVVPDAGAWDSSRESGDGIFSPVSDSPGQYQTPQSVYTPPVSARQPVDAGNSALWLALNIALAILCCCTLVGSIPAIIGIVFAGMAISKANAGYADTARQYERWAMILFFATLVLGIVIYVLFIATGQFGLTYLPNFREYGFDYSEWFDY